MDTTKIYTPRFTLPHVGRRLSLKSQKSVIETLPLLTDALKFERDKRAAEQSLYEFVKQAWHVVEPGVEFSEGWHIKIICEHLEAVSERRIKNLIINIPPRHSKSTISTVMWPVWVWLKHPEEKFLTASYSGSLSIRDAVKSRRLLESPWFKTRWPDITLNADQNTKQRYENTDTGYRIAASVGGTTTGEGGSILLCLRGDTLIETSNGQIPIKEIVENQLCTTIAGYNQLTGEVQFDRIVRYDKNPPKQMLSIKTKNGREVVLTDDHPVFVIGKGYIPSCEVKKGDRLLCRVQQRVKSTCEPSETCKDSGVQRRMSSCIDSQSSRCGSLCGVWEGSKEDASASSSKRDGYMLLQRVLRKITNWLK